MSRVIFAPFATGYHRGWPLWPQPIKAHQHCPTSPRRVRRKKWIRTRPASFCNTADRTILSQVLNDYDQETTDFYRWQVEYTQQELTSLLADKLHMDFGAVLDMIPVTRGKSGRIVTLKIVGTQRTLTLGKELEIRRALSKTHLYSSAFVVDKQDTDAQGYPPVSLSLELVGDMV